MPGQASESGFASADEVMDAILALDDLHRAGKIGDQAYQKRRERPQGSFEGNCIIATDPDQRTGACSDPHGGQSPRWQGAKRDRGEILVKRFGGKTVLHEA